MAALLRISLLLLLVLVYCSETYAQRGRGGGRSNFNRGGLNGRGGLQGSGGFGRGRGGGGRRYRSALYNDDDVYGYEANYPGGEALHINYKTSEARAKRAPEFERSSPYSAGGSPGFLDQDPGEMVFDAPNFGFQ